MKRVLLAFIALTVLLYSCKDEDVIKVRLHDLANVSFYLMGNDLVINNLVNLNVHFDENTRIITLSGEQEL